MPNTIVTNFPITVYGNMEKFSDTISKGRCRVFYKGHNRNGTYITDEFAEKLIKSAPYTPVKGIYDGDCEDYTDHGTARSEGRIYGVVPADPNFAWEKHTDSNGIEREYACFDVLYYTALYKEAGEIDGKSESMELYRKTLKGEWRVVEGKKAYVFTDGCFLGLQALGDDVEPCFEGASFYSLEDNIIALLEKYEKRADIFQKQEQGGNNIMPSINFKLSDGQKYSLLFEMLNPNFNEAGEWTIEYSICDVYDEYAIVRNFAEGIFERVYYKKDDETDSLEITKKERCYIIDVNEEEKSAVEAIKGEYTFAEVATNIAAAAASAVEAQSLIAEYKTSIDEGAATIASLTEKVGTCEASIETLTTENSALIESNENLTTANAEYSTKIEELNNSISTLISERDENQTNFENAQTRIAEIEAENASLTDNLNAVTAERDELASYKKFVETEAKKAVVEGYSDHLSEEVIESFMNNLEKYSIEDLDKELTYAQKKANPSLFNKNPIPASTARLPKEDDGERGINSILAKYEKH